MRIIGFFIVLGPAIITLFCLIWLLFQSFRASIGWGIVCLLFPPSFLFFIPMYWNRTKWPTIILVITWLVMISLFFISGSMAGHGLSEMLTTLRSLE